jgi:ATP-binding cassette subfamily B protein
LISRINSDVIGAQRAFTSTFSGIISNVLTLILVVGTMLALSWQITVASLMLLPVFLAPTKWIGGRLQGYTRDSYELNAEMILNNYRYQYLFDWEAFMDSTESGVKQ